MPAILVGDRMVKFKIEGEYVLFEGEKIRYSVLSAEEGRLIVEVGNALKEIIYSSEHNAVALFANSTTTTFKIITDRDLLLQNLIIEESSHHHHAEIKAPIPGLVVKVFINKGDYVKRGETLAVLEAMKMENEIRVSQDSEVLDVLVKAGDRVEKDQVIAFLQ